VDNTFLIFSEIHTLNNTKISRNYAKVSYKKLYWISSDEWQTKFGRILYPTYISVCFISTEPIKRILTFTYRGLKRSWLYRNPQ
jgi:beta-mannanase